ncbi:MAG: Fe-S cluster assembly protein SufB [Candidatus Shikimatogenerans sp. Tcar]|uniref:Fe-S cluster assembly protein SufB n=1 Tax=Candidatus Shikimatogenerans sp. Tcar TaxID=3158565 RepID=A0AAU7QS56_9FLAO
MNNKYKKYLKNIYKYKYNFKSNFITKNLKKGLNKNIIKYISIFRKESKLFLKFRLSSYKIWKKKKYPKWSNLKYKKINFKKIVYFSKFNNKNENKEKNKNVLKKTIKKLNIFNNKKMVLDFVLDSNSIKTMYNNVLKNTGIIFCSLSKAIKKFPKLVYKYLGKVVPITDNYFSALNSAIFSDGSFCYIPKNVKCPIDLSTYFRINDKDIGQFERTLIIADENSKVSYIEGCTAPKRLKNQLHAAVVEIIALKNAKVKYSTIQNWYSGNKHGKGGIYNFVTKRGICYKKAKISWIQIEMGSLITWKYPSCILLGNKSVGNFYSIALTKNYQQCDTGSKMIHIGNNTKSSILSKSICLNNSRNTYRSLVYINKKANKSENYSQCDSILIGNKSNSFTYPTIKIKNNRSITEHEAKVSLISKKKLFYCYQRGILKEKSILLIINGFIKDIFIKLPLEYSIEIKKLIEIILKKSIG